MKIAFYSEFFKPQLSGVADSLDILSRSLAKKGHEVIIFAPETSGVLNLKWKPDPKVKVKHMKVRRVISIPFLDYPDQKITFPIGIGEEIEEFGPDIIHTHEIFSLGISARNAAKKLGVPLVVTAHTPLEEYKRFIPPPPFLKDLLLFWVKRYYNSCDFITVPSEFMKEQLKQRGVKKPIEVVSNPVDTDLFRPLKKGGGVFRERFGFKEKDFVVLYFGRISRSKKIYLLLRAFSLLRGEVPDCRLLIVGDGADTENLKHLANRLRIAEDVVFQKSLFGEELVSALNAADIYVSASTVESQSLTTLQAMAAGLPTVAVRASAIPEVMPDGRCGLLVKPNSFVDLEEKMRMLAGDEKMREKFSLQGRERALNFSRENVVPKFEKIYKRLIEERRKNDMIKE